LEKNSNTTRYSITFSLERVGYPMRWANSFSLRRQDPVGFFQPTDIASFYAYGQRYKS
jgi:hypothetical protein